MVESDCNAAHAFETLWVSMSDILGPAATATLLQKSLRRAAVTKPVLGGLDIRREGFEYRYTFPADWTDNRPELVEGLQCVVAELAPLLQALTGEVVIRKLNSDPLLQRCRIHFEEGEG